MAIISSSSSSMGKMVVQWHGWGLLVPFAHVVSLPVPQSIGIWQSVTHHPTSKGEREQGISRRFIDPPRRAARGKTMA